MLQVTRLQVRIQTGTDVFQAGMGTRGQKQETLSRVYTSVCLCSSFHGHACVFQWCFPVPMYVSVAMVCPCVTTVTGLCTMCVHVVCVCTWMVYPRVYVVIYSADIS